MRDGPFCPFFPGINRNSLKAYDACHLINADNPLFFFRITVAILLNDKLRAAFKMRSFYYKSLTACNLIDLYKIEQIVKSSKKAAIEYRVVAELLKYTGDYGVSKLAQTLTIFQIVKRNTILIHVVQKGYFKIVNNRKKFLFHVKLVGDCPKHSSLQPGHNRSPKQESK